MRDFVALKDSDIPMEQYYYETAEKFLFDDNYTVWWGDEEKTLKDFMEFIDIDIVYFREGIIKKAKKYKKKNRPISSF